MSAFFYEQDDVRPEAAKGQSAIITIVPKVDGAPADLAGISPGQWTVTESGGLQLSSGSVNATGVVYGDRTAAQYVVTVPGIDRIQEDCILTLRWTTDDGIPRTEVVVFDVVVAPLGALVSVNDLMRIRLDADKVLRRIGQNLGVTTSEQASVEAGARSVAVLARQALQAKLHDRAERDGSPRPAQLLDRRRVAHVEALLALQHMYASVANDPIEGEDHESALFRHFRNQADAAMESMKLAYQTGDDLNKAGVTNFGSTFRLRREQA